MLAIVPENDARVSEVLKAFPLRLFLSVGVLLTGFGGATLGYSNPNHKTMDL